MIDVSSAFGANAYNQELPARRRTTTAESKANIAAVELPSNLAIKILSNLLSANMDVGLQLCLSLGYHEDPVLRCAFIELTASVLRNGSPFGVLGNQTSQSRHETPYLDALVWEGPDYETDNLAFAVAICEVCPPAQVDEMLGLLFRSLETNGLLLSLIKIMVEKEVAQTSE
jgi:neurofibromin 1